MYFCDRGAKIPKFRSSSPEMPVLLPRTVAHSHLVLLGAVAAVEEVGSSTGGSCSSILRTWRHHRLSLEFKD